MPAYGSEGALWKRRALKRDRQSSASGWERPGQGSVTSGERACTSVCCTRESALGGKAGLEADGREAGAALNTLGFVL